MASPTEVFYYPLWVPLSASPACRPTPAAVSKSLPVATDSPAPVRSATPVAPATAMPAFIMAMYKVRALSQRNVFDDAQEAAAPPPPPAQELSASQSAAVPAPEAAKLARADPGHLRLEGKAAAALHGVRKKRSRGGKDRKRAPVPAPLGPVTETLQQSASTVQAQLEMLKVAPAEETPALDAGAAPAAPDVSAQLASLTAQLEHLTMCISTLQTAAKVAPAPAPPPPSVTIPDAQGRHFVVFDTCALVRAPTAAAKFLTSVRKTSAACLLAPLEVLRELDHLKQSAVEETSSAARRGIKLFREAASEPAAAGIYRGQRESELLHGRARRGDSGILDCMLLFKKAGAAKVDLVTEDHNMALRAVAEGFAAVAPDKVMSLLGEVEQKAKAAPAIAPPQPQPAAKKAAAVPSKTKKAPPPPKVITMSRKVKAAAPKAMVAKPPLKAAAVVPAVAEKAAAPKAAAKSRKPAAGGASAPAAAAAVKAATKAAQVAATKKAASRRTKNLQNRIKNRKNKDRMYAAAKKSSGQKSAGGGGAAAKAAPSGKGSKVITVARQALRETTNV